MESGTSIFAGRLVLLVLLVPLSACVPGEDSNGGGGGTGPAATGGGGGSGAAGRGGSGGVTGGAGTGAGAIATGGLGGRGGVSGGAGMGGASAAGGTGGGGVTGGAGSGGASATGGASGATGGSAYTTFADVRYVVGVFCGGSGCHHGGTKPTMDDNASLYTTLTTYKSAKCGNRVLVKPGSPQESAFYLSQKGESCGALPLMPFGCVDICTPPEYVEGIRQWIANGAPR